METVPPKIPNNVAGEPGLSKSLVVKGPSGALLHASNADDTTKLDLLCVNGETNASALKDSGGGQTAHDVQQVEESFGESSQTEVGKETCLGKSSVEERIRRAESALQESLRNNSALEAHASELRMEANLCRDEAENANARVEMLQTYLDAAVSSVFEKKIKERLAVETKAREERRKERKDRSQELSPRPKKQSLQQKFNARIKEAELDKYQLLSIQSQKLLSHEANEQWASVKQPSSRLANGNPDWHQALHNASNIPVDNKDLDKQSEFIRSVKSSLTATPILIQSEQLPKNDEASSIALWAQGAGSLAVIDASGWCNNSKEENNHLTSELLNHHEQCAIWERRLASLTSDNEILQSTVRDVLKKNENLQKQVERLHGDLVAKEIGITSLQKTARTQRETIADLETRHRDILNLSQCASNELEDRNMELSDALELQKLLRKELKQCRERITTQENERKHVVSENAKLTEKVASLHDECSGIRARMVALENGIRDNYVRVNSVDTDAADQTSSLEDNFVASKCLDEGDGEESEVVQNVGLGVRATSSESECFPDQHEPSRRITLPYVEIAPSTFDSPQQRSPVRLKQPRYSLTFFRGESPSSSSDGTSSCMPASSNFDTLPVTEQAPRSLDSESAVSNGPPSMMGSHQMESCTPLSQGSGISSFCSDPDKHSKKEGAPKSMDDDRSNADSPDSQYWEAPVELEVTADIRQAAAQMVKGITVEEVTDSGDQWALPTHIVLRPATFTADSRPPSHDDNSAFEENSFDSHAEACALRMEQRSQVEKLDDDNENNSTKEKGIQPNMRLASLEQSFVVRDDQRDVANSPEIDTNMHSEHILPVGKTDSNRQIGDILEDPDGAILLLADVNRSQISKLDRAGTSALDDTDSHIKSQLKVPKDSMAQGKEEMYIGCGVCDDHARELQVRVVQCQIQTVMIEKTAREIKDLRLKIAFVEKEKEELRRDSDQRLNNACGQLNELESTVYELESELAHLEGERDSLTTEIERQQKRLESAMSQLNEMEHALTMSEEDLATAEVRINILEGRINALSNQSANV